MTGLYDPEMNTWEPIPSQGWRYSNIHPENDGCRIDGCMIHNPDTEWAGAEWPYFPRGDGRIERTCLHGVGHPDPNTARFLTTRGWSHAAAYTHGCDGCCTSEVTA